MSKSSSFRILCASALAVVCAAQVSLAQNQELTTDEITDAFNKQKTHGLVLVPSSQGGNATDETETTIATAPAGYQPVAGEEQVNIQIRFDFASAALREDEKPKLSSLCQAMKNVDVNVFQIIGHTDSSGSAEYNRNLSLLPAKEVKRFLVGDCGIADERLEVVGAGEAEPLNKDDPRADENRRVEFQALG